MYGWLIFLALLAGYLGLVTRLRNRQKPLPWGFELNGVFVMWRTQVGKRAIERVARLGRFWNGVADVGIVATWIVGLAVFALLLYSFSLYFTATEVVAQSETSPAMLLGIPGVNPLIPIWYGIAALLVALVVHEGSHGVMAYVARMRVKSLGLLFFIIPVGAFVEPDEEDLHRSSARAQNRVFAAGPTSNLVLALVAGILLSTAFLGSLAVANGGEGVAIAQVVPGEAAEAAGLRAGDLLVAFDGEPVKNTTHYTRLMNGTRAGQVVDLTILRDGQTHEVRLKLGDRLGYYQRVAPESELARNMSHRGQSFMGITPVDLRLVTVLRDVMEDPFQDGFPGSFATSTQGAGSFMFYVSYPFIVYALGMDIFSEPYRSYLVVEGPMAGLPEPLFFGLATFLYWVVWVNIMLGTFNALPMGPLDGGQMLRTTLRDRLMGFFRVDRSRVSVARAEVGGIEVKGRDEETQQKLDRVNRVVRRVTWTVGFTILGLVLLPLVGPRLLNLLL